MKTLLSLVVLVIFLTGISLRAAILGGPITNQANGHVYFLLTTNSWAGSEAEAVSLGGHLVTINDAAEDSFVYTNFSKFAGTNRYLWIGLNDLDVRGTYQWVSGESSTYRNWATWQPTCWAGSDPEDCGSINPPSSGYPGKWNDAGTNSVGYYGVVEVIPGVASQLSIYTAVEIAWASQTTNNYQIQWASLLGTNNWFNLGSAVQGTGTTNYFFDSTRSGSQRFYRVLTLP